MQKQRGKFLTIMIVLGVLGLLQYLYYLSNTNLVEQTFGTVPEWYPVYALAGVLTQGVAIVGIWTWKRWGVYAFFGWIVVGLLAQLIVLKPLQYGEVAFLATGITAALWFWAVYRKWKFFE